MFYLKQEMISPITFICNFPLYLNNLFRDFFSSDFSSITISPDAIYISISLLLIKAFLLLLILLTDSLLQQTQLHNKTGTAPQPTPWQVSKGKKSQFSLVAHAGTGLIKVTQTQALKWVNEHNILFPVAVL